VAKADFRLNFYPSAKADGKVQLKQTAKFSQSRRQKLDEQETLHATSPESRDSETIVTFAE